MEQKFTRTTVHLAERDLHQLDQLCVEKGTTRSSLIRDAVIQYLASGESPKANLERMAMTSEFSQVAVDILIRKLAPDRRDDLIATVDERMELYHAGR